ncbi:SH3 domain protein [Cooperia oncophora]
MERLLITAALSTGRDFAVGLTSPPVNPPAFNYARTSSYLSRSISAGRPGNSGHGAGIHYNNQQPEVPASTGQRRGSVMYDAASDEEEDADDEGDEQLDDVEEVEEEVEEETVAEEPRATPAQLPPQPLPRTEKAVTHQRTEPTAPSTQSAKAAKAATEERAPTERIEGEQTMFVAMADLPASEASDLSIVEGEQLRILQTRPDGWWTARNAKGEVGLVPKTYLRQAPISEVTRSDTGGTREVSGATRSASSTMGRPATSQFTSLLDPNQLPTRKARCLGDAQEMDPHLSFACHLTPRLSHSNIGFHDLYWNYRDDKLRKRRVRVSKLVRLVRLEGMPRDAGVCLVRTALYDRSRKTGRQITDTASSGVDYGDFIVRSNYNMADVVLLIEASHVIQTQAGYEERSLGILTIDLIAKGEVVFNNKTYSEMLRAENIFDRTTNGAAATPHKIVLKCFDVPKSWSHLSSNSYRWTCFIFNPMFVRLYFYFRRFAGISLLRDRDNHLSAVQSVIAEMVADPLLALFPSVADEPDLMDQLRNLWNTKLKSDEESPWCVQRSTKKAFQKPEADQADSFLRLFMSTTYCVHKTAVMPPYRIWDTKALGIRHQVCCSRFYRLSTDCLPFWRRANTRPLPKNCAVVTNACVILRGT